MRSKAWIVGILGLVAGAVIAGAESESLLEIAPFCRSVVKARFAGRQDGALTFQVEEVYVGSAPAELRVPAGSWREAWGNARPGFEGFFLFTHNREVDAVHPIVAGTVLTELDAWRVGGEERSRFWRPLAEIEGRLAEVRRHHCSLGLAFSSSNGDRTAGRVVFTNRGKAAITVKRGGSLEYRVFDAQRRLLAWKIEPGGSSVAAGSIRLQPGESTAVEAPASLLKGVAGAVQVEVTYAVSGTGDEPFWYGTQEAEAWLFLPPAPGSFRPGPMVAGAARDRQSCAP